MTTPQITPATVRTTVTRLTGPGEMFEVTQRTIAGRDLRVYAHASSTMVDLMNSGRGHSEKDFLVYEGHRWRFDDFYAEVDALAAALQHDLGISPGDRVAIAMRNCPDWMVAFTATIMVGAIAVPINSWGQREDLEFSLTDSGANVLVADTARAWLVRDALGDLDLTVLLGDGPSDTEKSGELLALTALERLEDIVNGSRGRAYEQARPSPEDIAVLLYTSGSTGKPKGVVQRHVAVCQAVMNMFLVGYVAMDLEGPTEPPVGAAPESQLLSVPLFHATGLMSGLVLPTILGQKVVILRKWDALAALKLIESEKITSMASVPAIFKDLLTHPDFGQYATSSLIRLSLGGAATPADLPGLIRDRVGLASRSSGYGMTETMAVAATMSGPVFDLRPDASGVLSPIIEMRFVSPAGQVLPAGDEGEIQLRGVTVTPGYWNLDETSNSSFTDDGWLHTGDIGRVDNDGFLYVTGRIKEMAIRGGENIYPIEIENAAYRHPAVKEAAAFGVPDTTLGEELAIVCHLQPGATLTENGLRAHLRELLAHFKVPKYITFSPTPLPRNMSEKLHRLELRRRHIAQSVTDRK